MKLVVLKCFSLQLDNQKVAFTEGGYLVQKRLSGNLGPATFDLYAYEIYCDNGGHLSLHKILWEDAFEKLRKRSEVRIEE